MKKLVLITVHGMGVTKPDYSDELQRGLANRLGDHWQAVSVQPVWYAPVFQKNEDALWSALASEPRNDLDFARQSDCEWQGVSIYICLEAPA